MEEMKRVNNVWLKDIRRRFRLPFPLESVGFIEGHCYASVAIRGKLELCIRLSSTSEFARDQLDGTVYVNRFPNICLKLPEALHTFTVDGPRDAIYFKYDPSLADAMKAAGFLTLPHCWEFKMKPEYSRILREVRELMAHSQEYGVADRLDLLAMQLFEELLFQRDRKEQTDYMDAKMQRIASFFQLNFLEEIDFDGIAQKNGLSRRNFFHSWHRSFKLTPAAYIQQLKLNEARRLLHETNMPVWEITNLLRFRNSSYFCLLFKEHYGVTPLQFRKARSD